MSSNATLAISLIFCTSIVNAYNYVDGMGFAVRPCDEVCNRPKDAIKECCRAHGYTASAFCRDGAAYCDKNPQQKTVSSGHNHTDKSQSSTSSHNAPTCENCGAKMEWMCPTASHRDELMLKELQLLAKK